jgi:organic hydroperoxide reductase OsmC/OhrA
MRRSRLHVPAGADVARAKLLLEKAEQNCVITNSLSGSRELVTEIIAG